MKKILLLLLPICAIICSCDKKKNGASLEAQKTMLTTGKWKLVSMRYVVTDPSQPQDWEATNSWQECLKDNLFIFHIDGTSTEDEGATKCDPGDPQEKPGDLWQLHGNQIWLSTDSTTGITDMPEILELTNSTFKIRYLWDQTSTGTVTGTYTYQKQ